MKFAFLLPLLLAGAFAVMGCVTEQGTTPQSGTTPQPGVNDTGVTKGTTSALSPVNPAGSTPRIAPVPVDKPAKHSETIITSLGQQVDVTVVGFEDSPLRFEQLVTAIDEVEDLLGIPFPAPKVNMAKVKSVSDGFCGHNQVTSGTRYIERSSIEIRVDDECDDTFATIAHEVAHTWFHGNDPANWIDEGLANSIEQQVVQRHASEETVYPPISYCESYLNIRELEQANPSRINSARFMGFSCNYSLGDGVFTALREHYGDADFNEQIARFARKEKSITYGDNTISDIRRVLGKDRAALDIINLWYSGQPEMRRYRHLDAVTWSFPPTVDGDYLHFSGTIQIAGTLHDFSLGESSYCPQFVLYEGIGDEEWVDSVSAPLPAGWSRDEDSRIITINHQIEPDTGKFSVTARVFDGILNDAEDLSLLVRSRVTTGADGFCNESTWYSHVPVSAGRIPSEYKTARFYHLDAIEWSFPPTIDGEYLHFAGKTVEPSMVHELTLGNDPYCSQFSLYRNSVNQEFVAPIRDPVLVGWKHREIPQIVIVDDQINPQTGEFSITSMLNDRTLAQIPELSVLVKSRVSTGPDNVCMDSDSLSQAAVTKGTIPTALKNRKHYHRNAIQWTSTPSLSGNTLRFAGKAAPDTIKLEWRRGYCSQFAFYERDELGYHYIDSLNPYLPGDRQWKGHITGEVTRYRVDSNGTFQATATIVNGALSGYENVVLVVSELAPLDSVTNKCTSSEVLSALDVIER